MTQQLTTARKVGIGFALMTLVLLSAVAATLWQTARTRTVTHELINRSGPMSDASLRIINGVNYAVSQLRGWILMGDERFKTGRTTAWNDWIDPSVADLKRLVDEGGSQVQRDQFKVVDNTSFLLQASLFRRSFYRFTHLFDLGRPEDIETGRLISLTGARGQNSPRM